MTSLAIPDIPPDADVLSAVLRYGDFGWYLNPVRRGQYKNPGSVVGKGWPAKSSRDPKVNTARFAGTSHGIALHLGRSGAIAFDVDFPDRLPDSPALARAIEECQPPWQASRPNTRRGHYLFAQPPGRMLGNGKGRLGGTWGEIRGRNGVIIVAPSVHEKHASGAAYVWQRPGALPVLPEYVAELLDDSTDANDAATDAEVADFLAAHTHISRPELLSINLGGYAAKVNAGESRHETMVVRLVWAMKEAAAGFFDARTAADTLEASFLAAVARDPKGKQGAARTGALAREEWRGLLAWAVGQAKVADLDAVRERVARKLPSEAEVLRALGVQP